MAIVTDLAAVDILVSRRHAISDAISLAYRLPKASDAASLRDQTLAYVAHLTTASFGSVKVLPAFVNVRRLHNPSRAPAGLVGSSKAWKGLPPSKRRRHMLPVLALNELVEVPLGATWE